MYAREISDLISLSLLGSFGLHGDLFYLCTKICS